MKREKYFVISIFLIFISFGVYTKFYGNSNSFDYIILSNIRSTIYPSFLFRILTKIGNMSSYFFILTPTLIYLAWKKKMDIFSSIIFSVVVSAVFMLLFKNIFQRIRPEEFFVINENGFSYPSGHSVVSAATYWTIYKILKKGRTNIAFLLLLFLLPILIGFSRLVLGVHWPTDVIIGLLTGYCISIISVYFFIKEGK